MLTGVFLALVSFGPATTGFAQGTTRAEMTLALAKALDIFQPPACVPGQEMFNDVPASSPFCPFIEELSRRGITGGCGGGNFCPGDPVTRQQMAVFLVKAVADEAFHIVGASGEPAFGNGGQGDCLWRNPPPNEVPDIKPASFYKDSDGIVHLAGAPQAVNGTGGDMTCNIQTGDLSDGVIFQLPPGYRPDHVEVFASGNSTIVITLIAPDGGVTIGGFFIPGGSVFVINIAAGNATTLSGITFRAAPAATASSVSRQPASISLEALRNLLGRGSVSRTLDGNQ
jgi:hypothetical protein